MYLSRLLLDHLDRRIWRVLSDPGETHRFILRAFPAPLAHRVLFRVEPEGRGSRSTVLVQSPVAPDWSFLRDTSPTAHPSSKVFDLQLLAGAKYRFRLRANPTVKREGKRLGYLREHDVRAWFRRKGERHGFVADHEQFLVRPEGAVQAQRGNGHSATFQGHLLEGILTAAEPTELQRAVELGIGSGKAFGFGLMSLGPFRGG